MGKRFLIDKNIISYLFSERLPETAKAFVKAVIDADFIISVAVETEVLTYLETPDKMLFIEAFINLATILPLDKAVTKKAIELRRNRRKLKLVMPLLPLQH